MRRADAIKILLLTAVCALPVRASDWVEEGAVNNFKQPMPPKQTKIPPPRQPESSNDGAMSVTDPGAPGTVPEQHSHPLEGNVSGYGMNSAYAGSFYAQPQTPKVAPPLARTVQPKAFQAWLRDTHPDLGVHTKNEVVNIKGQWDDSSHALKNFGVLCNKMPASKMSLESLAETKIIVVDCAGDLKADELKMINLFVRNGGYLLTTDWALEGCLTRAIPGYISWNSGYSAKALVDATVVAPDFDLMRNTPMRAYWNLDMKCQTVHIMKANAVQVLARSRLLMRDDPDQLGILAVTFPYGKGRVLHLVGHFDSNSDRAFNNMLPDPAPGIEISLRQAIAGNFVAEALKSRKQVPQTTSQADSKQPQCCIINSSALLAVNGGAPVSASNNAQSSE